MAVKIFLKKATSWGPTIFDRVTMDMKIWQDEIFAPVASIVRVKKI